MLIGVIDFFLGVLMVWKYFWFLKVIVVNLVYYIGECSFNFKISLSKWNLRFLSKYVRKYLKEFFILRREKFKVY